MQGDLIAAVRHGLEILAAASVAVVAMFIFREPINHLLEHLFTSEQVVSAIEMAVVGALTALGGLLLKYRRTQPGVTDYVNE